MNGNGEWQELFINTTTDYSLNKTFHLWGGCVYYYSKDGGEITHEIRPWEAIMIYFPRIKGVTFQHLLRMEERFYFQPEAGYTGHGLRARYTFFGIIPLNHKEMVDRTIYLWPSIDYFMDLNGKHNESYVNKSRYNIGLGFRFSKFYRMEISYMAQFSKDAIGDHFIYADRIFRFVSHFTIY